MTPLLDVRDLSISDDKGALITHPMTIRLARGETIGLVGESGSGKSLTARAIAGLLPPNLTPSGAVALAGEELLSAPERHLQRLRGSRISLLFQDPFTMLNPLMRAADHIAEGLALHGEARSRLDLRAGVEKRLKEVGIDDRAVGRRYPFELSGGLRQRIGIASALSGDPDILIADEPATALDVTTQAEVVALLKRLQAERGLSLMLITHDLRLAFSVCDRVYVIYAGALLETGPSSTLSKAPAHPYTHGLILAEPPVDARMEQLSAIPGRVPKPAEVAGACAFSPRCPWAVDRCRSETPPFAAVAEGHRSACLRYQDIAGAMAKDRLQERGRVRRTTIGPSPPVPFLSIDGLEMSFGSGAARVQVLKGVTLDIARGQTLALVGESGSGKSTIGRCVLGLTTPDAGEITIDGHAAVRSDDRMRRTLSRKVQVVFQDPYSTLNPRHSVGFALKETLRAAGSEGDHDARISTLLDQVGLPRTYSTKRPAQLSGGERQRVAIARALAVSPALLVCDEPVSALDVSVQAQILNLLSELQRTLDLTMLFITHDLAVARQVADRVCVLFQGVVVESGDADQVLSQPSHPYTRRLLDAVPPSGCTNPPGD